MKVKFWRVFRKNASLSLKYGGSLSMENIVATFLQNMFGAVKNAKNHKVNKTKNRAETRFFLLKNLVVKSRVHKLQKLYANSGKFRKTTACTSPVTLQLK